jgi:hypothetical protein
MIFWVSRVDWKDDDDDWFEWNSSSIIQLIDSFIHLIHSFIFNIHDQEQQQQQQQQQQDQV